MLTPLHMVMAFVSVRAHELRLRRSQDGERGDIVQTVIIVALFAAAAIIIVGILVTKATTAANNVQTQ